MGKLDDVVKEAKGIREWRLSITHTERTAQAIAIAL